MTIFKVSSSKHSKVHEKSPLRRSWRHLPYLWQPQEERGHRVPGGGLLIHNWGLRSCSVDGQARGRLHIHGNCFCGFRRCGRGGERSTPNGPVDRGRRRLSAAAAAAQHYLSDGRVYFWIYLFYCWVFFYFFLYFCQWRFFFLLFDRSRSSSRARRHVRNVKLAARRGGDFVWWFVGAQNGIIWILKNRNKKVKNWVS